jgi:acetate kinase
VNAIVVNTGSSSVRLSSWTVEGSAKTLLRSLRLERGDIAPAEAFQKLGAPTPELIAHRVVHGGEKFVSPVVIDAAVEAEIERLVPLAPLHNPAALRGIRQARERFGNAVTQVAVFDTAFFAKLPKIASTYALPRELSERLGLRRFGFHGLAHQAMARACLNLGGGRLVTLQLGGGCSAAAIQNGLPLDTSMGFSPLEGLVMATRAGDVDPGLLLYLQKASEMRPTDLEYVLSQRSGLAGLAGYGGDLRGILRDGGEAAQLAVGIYCYRARKYLGAYLAVLGGADGIVFGGGVGENQPEIRARILAGMQWAGIDIDEAANAKVKGTSGRISRGAVDVRVAVVDEAAVILEEALLQWKM